MLYRTTLSLCVVVLLAYCCVGQETCSGWICPLCHKSIRPFGGDVFCTFGNTSTRPKLQAYVASSFCVTYMNLSESKPASLVGGRCPIGNQAPTIVTLPDDIDDLDSVMCGVANRTGGLCGKCKANHSLVVNSFLFPCVDTDSSCRHVNWLIYFMEQFIPIIIAYLVVVLFNIRAMEERANAFIFFAQVVSLNFNLVDIYKVWSQALDDKATGSQAAEGLTKVISGVYGIWNLQFEVFPNLCLTGHITILNALCLRYMTALFPLVLMLITYLLIELHARNCRVLVKLWRPVHNLLARFRRKLDQKTSIIDAFATFLLLSYTKFTVVSFSMLAPTQIVNDEGEIQGYVLLYDGQVQYFKDMHWAYFALAVTVLLLVVTPPPVLLFLYPTKKFQQFIDRFKLRSAFLTTFTDAFQGCYKDSSDGGRDCRFFAGLYFVMRVVIFATYSFIGDYLMLYATLQVLIVTMAALFVIFRPYKKDIYNKLDPLIFIFYSVLITLIMLARKAIEHQRHGLLLRIQIVLYILLLIPAAVLLCFKLVQCFTRLCRKRQRYTFYHDGSHFGPNSSIQSRQYTLISQPISGSSPETTASLNSDSDTSED